MEKETVYVAEAPKGMVIITNDMLIVGTGEKYIAKDVRTA